VDDKAIQMRDVCGESFSAGQVPRHAKLAWDSVWPIAIWMMYGMYWGSSRDTDAVGEVKSAVERRKLAARLLVTRTYNTTDT